MNTKSLEFDGGGFLTLTQTEDGVEILFQAPYMEEQFRITSMNVQLTHEQAAELSEWLVGGTDRNE